MMIPKISEYERSCLNCKHLNFKFMQSGRRKLNRECCYEGTISVKRGVCQQWEDTRTFMQRLRRQKIMKAFC